MGLNVNALRLGNWLFSLFLSSSSLSSKSSYSSSPSLHVLGLVVVAKTLMSVSGCPHPVPTSVSTPLAASSASARLGATCWATGSLALGWRGCPVMRAIRTVIEHRSPRQRGASTSGSTTAWPLSHTIPFRVIAPVMGRPAAHAETLEGHVSKALKQGKAVA